MEKLEVKLDPIHTEAIQELAEMAYKEGLRDGMRFMGWTTITTN